VKLREVTGQSSLRLSVRPHDHQLKVPSSACQVFRANDIQGFEAGDDFYLTDGSSILRLEPSHGYGDVRLDAEFFAKPLTLQVDFLAFGVVKLLRPLGLYGLHAAAVITQEGLGLLVVGQSGSGKSTLSIGLIQKGWRYLTDEVVLLRRQPEWAEALALCKGFYLNDGAARLLSDIPLGEEVPVASGGLKRRIEIEAVYPRQYAPHCIPRVVLFSRIVPEAQSSLRPLDRLTALKHLLMQSGPQWFDRGTMDRHLEAIKTLIQQSAIFELRAGQDLYDNPLTLVRLLAEAQGEGRWPRGLSLS
jgi:hypothetical protein